ncbi:MAG: AMP-binding protein [Candidatus Ratteibacteria bacterium]|jgi:phenylacetate-CoA ligase
MTDLYSGQDIEFKEHEKINAIQQLRLQQHLKYCLDNSPFYRRLLEKCKTDLKNITLRDLPKIPFTEKTDIERHNEDFLSVPLSKIVDIVMSSGTTGKPTRIMYTEHDLKRLAYNEEQSFKGCGLSTDDTALLTCTLDRCFVAGLAYFSGIRAIGAAAVRSGLNTLESHAEIIKQTNPTVIVGVPTFLKKLGKYVAGKKIGHRVKKLVCIGEPLRDENLGFLKLGRELEEVWQAKAYSTYSSSEIITTFCECTAQQGGHLHPDLAVVEIVDKNNRVLPFGNTGEVVVTPLAVEGMPLIRFKTGDMSFLVDNPCACGRNSLRLGPILGRKKQMMKIRGTTLYPQTIYSALAEIGAVSEYYVIVTSENYLSDNLEVHASVNDKSLTVETVVKKLQAHLRISPKVFIETEEEIRQKVYDPKFRKPVRFVDKR